MKATMKVITLVTLFLLIGCSRPGTQEATPPHLEAAKARAMQLCAGCHGAKGIGTAPFNPNLACQKKDYLVSQLGYYRDGTRTTHKPMSNIAKLLTEEEVHGISEWYSRCP